MHAAPNRNVQITVIIIVHGTVFSVEVDDAQALQKIEGEGADSVFLFTHTTSNSR